MALLVRAEPAASAQPQAARPAPLRLSWLTCLLLTYFAMTSAYFGYKGVERFDTHWTWLNDLHFYYDAAKVATSDQRALLHDNAGRVEAGIGDDPSAEVFPLPATLALLFWPLTLLDHDDARIVFLALSVLAGAAIVGLAYLWSRDLVFAGLVALAQASLLTYYEVMRFSQLAPFIALLSCAALLCLAQRREYAGGLLAGLIVLKPSFVVAPLILMFLLRYWRATMAAVAVCALVVILIPLAVEGVDGLRHYLRQLGIYREEAFWLDGVVTAGAGWMLNWNGFVARLLVDDPPVLAVVALDSATVLVFLVVCLRQQDVFYSWLAGVIATVLVVPHAVWYDWAILLGVAPFVLYAHRSLPLMLLLVALHFSISFDTHTILTTSTADRAFFSTDVIAAAILLYLALAPPKRARERAIWRMAGWKSSRRIT
jgi:hypothetical protein